MMMYSTHCLVNVIAGEAGASQRGRRWAARLGGAAWLALVGAVAMTAWDLSMDPVMVRLGAWVCHVPGPYFGITLRNYLGWLETTFVVFLLYRLFEGRWPARPNSSLAFAYLPVVAYAFTWLRATADNLLNGDPALGLIAFFAMGSFVLAALTALFARRQ